MPLAGVLVATAAAMFMVQLDFFALNLALPPMAEDLGVSVDDLQWVISGYMLAVAAFLIPGGRLGDVLGRRRMLIAGTALFMVSSAACGLSSSAELIIGFRVVQGVGAAIMFPLCVAVISNAYPAQRQARAIGNLYGLAAIATALGPFVGGAFTDLLSWRWIFFLNLPIGVLAIAALLHFVEESRDETVPRRLDWPGLAAVALGIALVTFAVDRGQEWGWLGVRTIAVFLAGLVLLAVFVAIERRVRWPLVDLGLFRNRPYVLVTLLGTVSNVAFTSATLATTIYLQQVRDFSPLAAGSIFLACSLALAVTGPLAGRLGERFAVSRVIPVSIGIGAASGVTLAVVVGLGGLGVAITAAMIEALTASGTPRGEAIESILIAVAIGSALLGGALDLLSRRAAARVTAAAA